MGRLTYDVKIDLDRIICHEEADGCGSAEPYLWTAFFRMGGDDVSVELESIDFSQNPPKPIVQLSGNPLLKFGHGSHGNLGDTDVDAGDTVSIPAAIGQFETRLKPIPIPQDLINLGNLFNIEVPEDLPGFVGAVVVLMEEDNVSDSGAEAGHQALNGAIRVALEQIIETRNINNPGVSKTEIEAFSSSISGTVKDAIQNQQNFFQNLWSWLNEDDQIGNHVLLYSSDDFKKDSNIPVKKRWKNHGDWELNGDVIATPLCPADALAAILDHLFGKKETFEYKRDALVKFRDYEFAKFKGAMAWWKHLDKNKLELCSMILKNKKLQRLSLDLFNASQDLVQKPEQKIDDKHIEKAVEALKILQQSKNRSTSMEAKRMIDFVNRAKGKSVGEVLKIMNYHSPSRYHRSNAKK